MQSYQEHASPLLHRAADRVIEHMVGDRESITHLVTISCTGFGAPGIDYQLIESLGLRSDLERTHVGFMGCHGLINGLRVPIDEWLASENLALENVCAWAVHPGGPRVIDAAGQALGLEDSQLQASRDVLAQFGNMSSPTVLFILERLQPLADAGDHAVMLAFGPGLQVEALLLRHA